MTALAEAAPAHHGLDTPHPFQPASNYFQLAGWAFVAGAPQPSRTRVVIGDQIFEPAETIDRPDVAAAYPAEPHALKSGFKFICFLPFGVYEGRLEVSADGQAWRCLRPLAIPVTSHPIRGEFEPPAGSGRITTPVRIEGWCFHPEFKVDQIVLQFGNVEVPCDYGLERPDVAARFPEHPASRWSGFITGENLPRGAGRIKVRARTECGRTYFVQSNLDVDIAGGWIPKQPPPSPIGDLETLSWTTAPKAAATPVRPAGAGPGPTGDRNILFVLYGDFFANSALHVANLANELIKVGYDCVVAVPDQKETLRALPRADFRALQFDELSGLAGCFKDGRGPRVVQAWTTRENVRTFCREVAAAHGSALFVHLEDNEQELLATRLGRPYAELAALPDTELDRLVPPALSHPHRAPEFLRDAAASP